MIILNLVCVCCVYYIVAVVEVPKSRLPFFFSIRFVNIPKRTPTVSIAVSLCLGKTTASARAGTRVRFLLL